VFAEPLVGSADTRTPMYVRSLTLPTNLVLNAVLIFGLGPFPRPGIVGAALGTIIANTVAAVVFRGLLVSGRHTVTLPVRGRQVDPGLLRETVRVALPLSGMRLMQTFGRFPFLFVLGIPGTPALAAYAIGRRVIMLALMPAWADFYVRAAVNTGRFRSERWKSVARASGVGTGADVGDD